MPRREPSCSLIKDLYGPIVALAPYLDVRYHGQHKQRNNYHTRDQRQGHGQHLSLGDLIHIFLGFINAFNTVDINTNLLHFLAIAQTGQNSRVHPLPRPHPRVAPGLARCLHHPVNG